MQKMPALPSPLNQLIGKKASLSDLAVKPPPLGGGYKAIA